MNNIDYELEILGEQKTYSPREEFIAPIINSKKKIFEITADNSYGKTFILNLIAYALEADKLDDDRILGSIKDAISRYDNQASYNLKYDIELDLPDNKKLLLSKDKGRGKIIQIDDSAPISHNVLHKDLSVIYDVPTNPSERLNAVIKDLGAWNENLRKKFEMIARHFYNISKEFDSVRDEDKIESLTEESKQIINKILKNEQDVKLKKALLDDLKLVKNLTDLQLLFKKQLEIETKIFKKDKQFNLLKKPVKVEKKDETKIKQLNSELTQLEKNFKDVISKLIAEINNDIEISELISGDTYKVKHYNRIKESEIREIFLSDKYVEKQTKFIGSVEYIKDTIIRFISEKKNDKSYIIHNSYKQFIDLLEELMENEIDHLLKNATTVDSKKLKQQLEALVSDYKIKNYDSLKRFLNSDLKPLKGYLTQFMRTQIQLTKESKKKLINDDDSTYYKIQAELRGYRETLKSVKNNFNLTSALCASELKISDLSKFNSNEKIADLKYNVKNNISNPKLLEDLNTSIGFLEKELRSLKIIESELIADKKIKERYLEMEKNKNPSRYNDEQKKKIKLFLQMLTRINASLGPYGQLISEIENGNLSKFKHEGDFKFMELAGKIIAHSMDNKLLRMDGEFVELKFYDMLKQEFHCSDNLIIKKADVSTGLASANYLKQRIENVEGKYVVVLLDEIGNMAQNALNTVIDSIKKLEKQNRLVLAVFTRPNSKGIKIIEY